MQIKRLLNLTEEEFKLLVAAGELLGAIKRAKENNEFDELDDEAYNIIDGINAVVEKVLN